MAKAAAAKKKAKKRPVHSDKQQSERFKETARRLGVDEDETSFERAFSLIVPTRRARKDKS